MTNITETEPANYDEFVYQLDTEDELLGGEGGELNKAAKNLANRTKWLKRQIEDLSASSGVGVVPIHGIIMWTGSVAPKNWVLCDGNNGSPDLRGSFVRGAGGSIEVGETGGSADAVVVEHSHSLSDGGVRKTTGPYDYSGGSGYSQGDVLSETAQTGESGVNKNLPPYYALAYIMRVS